jgi:hypothetical protein
MTANLAGAHRTLNRLGFRLCSTLDDPQGWDARRHRAA